MNAEAWATLVVGIVAVVVQPISLYVTFQFGKSQARAQVRHQKAVEALVAALPIIRQLQLQFAVWAVFEKRSEWEIEYAQEIVRLRGELRSLIYDNSPWFEPHTKGKIEPIRAEVSRYYAEHVIALKSGDATRIAESGKRISEWTKEPYALRMNALEDEARQLMGTKLHWRSTRRGRFVVWLRRNIGWLASCS